MSPSKRATLQHAAGAIPEGALLTFGGFQLNRPPIALVLELIRQGRRRLRVIALPNPLPLDLLVGAGAVEEAEFGFCGFQYEDGFAVAPALRRAVQEGSLRWRERDVYELVQGLRASAMGLPFLPAPGVEGTDYSRVNGTKSVRSPVGDEVAVAEPIRPDILLVHAQEADPEGNLGIADVYAERLLARASDGVIATAERMVDRVRDPVIPGARVLRVAEAPLGARPGACHRHYRHDPGGLRRYLGLAGEGRHEEARRVLRAPDEAAPGPHPGSSARDATDEARAEAIDRLVVAMARCLSDGDVVTTGVASALPMLAVAVARATAAPRLTYINCVGAINPRLDRARATSVDASLLDDCEAYVDLPGLFDLARRGGIDAMFFGAAQVDAGGRINLTCVGDYRKPRVKLPGPAGSSSMRTFVPKVILVVPRHDPRTLVRRVDFATAVPSPRNRETWLVSDLALMRLEEGTWRVVSRHAGVDPDRLRSGTGFPLERAGDAITPEPTADEMAALRRLDPDRLRDRMV